MKLTVKPLKQKDAGRGLAAVDRRSMEELSVENGDYIVIEGHGQGRAVARGLQRNFGIEHPRLAFSGFNPHAGEYGAIGREEVEIIEPALDQLREEGFDCIGPLAADTLFHAAAREDYDAALCVYHDQALIPLKTLHFDEGVNMTLGLPIVRTAPDHGTAFDIAGRGRANPGAMIAAIGLAAFCAAQRVELAAKGA